MGHGQQEQLSFQEFPLDLTGSDPSRNMLLPAAPGNSEQVPEPIPWAVSSRGCTTTLQHPNFPFSAQAGENFPRQFLQRWLEELKNKEMGQEDKRTEKYWENFPEWKFTGVIGQAPGLEAALQRGGSHPKEFQELPFPTPSEDISIVWTPSSHIPVSCAVGNIPRDPSALPLPLPQVSQSSQTPSINHPRASQRALGNGQAFSKHPKCLRKKTIPNRSAQTLQRKKIPGTCFGSLRPVESGQQPRRRICVQKQKRHKPSAWAESGREHHKRNFSSC